MSLMELRYSFDPNGLDTAEWVGPERPRPSETGGFPAAYEIARKMLARAVGLEHGAKFPPMPEMVATVQTMTIADKGFDEGLAALALLREIGMLSAP